MPIAPTERLKSGSSNSERDRGVRIRKMKMVGARSGSLSGPRSRSLWRGASLTDWISSAPSLSSLSIISSLGTRLRRNFSLCTRITASASLRGVCWLLVFSLANTPREPFHLRVDFLWTITRINRSLVDDVLQKVDGGEREPFRWLLVFFGQLQEPFRWLLVFSPKKKIVD